MSEKKQYTGNKKPIVIGVLVFILLLSVTFFLSFLKYGYNLSQEKQRVQTSAHFAKSLLEEYLYQGLSVTRTLSYIIENNGIPRNFDLVGKELLESNRSIHAVEIVQKGTITHVFPLKGNEIVIGYDIFADTNRNKEAFKAIEKKSLFFAGPLELKQGGIAVVGRLPVFKNDSFIGFSAVIIKLDTLLAAAGVFPSYNPELEFQLSKTNPNTAKEEYFIQLPGNPVFDYSHSVDIEVPMGEWKLYAKMKEPSNFAAILPYTFAGIILSLLIGAFAWYKAKQPNELKRLVDEKVDMLNKNEKLLNVTQRTARVGSWEVDLINQNFRWTDTVKEILEVDDRFTPKLETLVQFSKEGIHRETLQKKITEAIQTGSPFDLEMLIITQKGKERWVRTTGKTEMKDGVCIHIYGATQDIHLSKLAKEEQKDILQSITDAFIAVDHQWMVTFWNTAAERMFEIPESKIMGKYLWDFISEKTSSNFYIEFLKALQTKEVRNFSYHFDELNIWVEISVYPKHGGLSAYLKDITLHHKHVNAIELQNKRLKEIAWMQSHVIRAPLVRLMGSVDLLAYKDETDENKHKLIQLIVNSAEELDVIIKDISDKTEEINITGDEQPPVIM